MRSRARPWWVLADRLERYSVRVDQLQESGQLWEAGKVLAALDFDVERPPPCAHPMLLTKMWQHAGGSWTHEFVSECADCGLPFDGQGALGRAVPPGFYEPPLFAPRWNVTEEDVYGREASLPEIGLRRFNEGVPPLTATEVLLREEERRLRSMEARTRTALYFDDRPATVLRPHQQQALERLAQGSMSIAWDRGTGKTFFGAYALARAASQAPAGSRFAYFTGTRGHEQAALAQLRRFAVEFSAEQTSAQGFRFDSGASLEMFGPRRLTVGLRGITLAGAVLDELGAEALDESLRERAAWVLVIYAKIPGWHR